MKQLTRLTETVVTDKGEYQILTKDAQILLQAAKNELIEANKELEAKKAQGCVSDETEEKVKVAKEKVDFLNRAISGEACKSAKESFQQIISIITKTPENWIEPMDKVTNKTFSGEIKPGHTVQVGTGKVKSKKIFAMVSLDFSDPHITITGKRELTPYDRAVYNAIVTLYVDGGNEYITPLMIYRAMTASSDAKLNPKPYKAISESLTKLMYSRLTIDASAEAAAYGASSFKYEGTAIAAERVTVACKGNVEERLHLLKAPILYEYASSKNQISRAPIELLSTPINKNEETIILQEYLLRRIQAMKNNDKLSKTILYDSVLQEIGIKETAGTQNRIKKRKIRDHTKIMLDYWKEKEFIKDYQENTKGTSIVSVTMEL